MRSFIIVLVTKCHLNSHIIGWGIKHTLGRWGRHWVLVRRLEGKGWFVDTSVWRGV